MNNHLFKNHEINFIEHSSGLCQASINSVSIPLLFELKLKEDIILILKELKIDEIPLEFAKQILTGCIKTLMRGRI